MKTITLQRQGVSDMLRGYLRITKKRYYYIEAGFHHGGKYNFATISYQNGNDHQHETYIKGSSKQDVLNKVESYLSMKAGPCKLQPFVEGYCFPFGLDRSSVKEWADRQAKDVYITCAVYCPYTDTIRHAGTNYCLIAWEKGDIHKPKFTVDAATEPFRAEIIRAHNEFLKEHNQRSGLLHAKGWLAWLCGEYLKDYGEKPVVIPSVLHGVIHSWTELKEVQL